jgi:hypothetical protein
VRNRGIGRARMFMGVLLLVAALLTWGIGLMMSPHGKAVAEGTDYLRATVLTYRRNGAIGTLVLCALAGWLLFPKRWSRRPVRDWSLFAVVALLVASSIYTLIWVLSFGHSSTINSAAVASDAINPVNVDENLAMMNPPATTNIAPDPNSAEVNKAPPAQLDQLGARSRPNASTRDRVQRDDQGQSVEPSVIGDEDGAPHNSELQSEGSEPSNSEADGNEE